MSCCCPTRYEVSDEEGERLVATAGMRDVDRLALCSHHSCEKGAFGGEDGSVADGTEVRILSIEVIPLSVKVEIIVDESVGLEVNGVVVAPLGRSVSEHFAGMGKTDVRVGDLSDDGGELGVPNVATDSFSCSGLGPKIEVPISCTSANAFP